MSISLGTVFEPFVEQRPICVMARGVLEHLFNAARIDALFARTAEMQYTRALLFSSVVDLRGQVVLGVQPSVHGSVTDSCAITPWRKGAYASRAIARKALAETHRTNHIDMQ